MTKSMPPKSLVLYADDDTDDLALLRDAFHQYSHVIELMTFHSGVELLQFLEQISPLQPAPCLIILDINMPRINGLEVLKKLRHKKDYEDTPVVLFSTSTLPAEADYARGLNAGFVTKPLVSGQIHQIVDALLAHCNDEIKQRLYRK
jgi:CheY-like chemotaxis protein